MKHPEKDQFKDLRNKAEKIYRTEQLKTGSSDQTRQQGIIQELQIGRIELELQNEELRETQVNLEKSRLRYIHLFQNAPVGYVILDEAGFIRQANTTFCRMIDVSETAIVRKVFADFLTEEDEKIFRSRLKSFFYNPAGKSMEVRFVSSLKNGIYSQLELIPQDPNKEIPQRELFVTITDITEQKTAEARIRGLLEDNELLLREVHHRLKNNMNTIIAMISTEIDMNTPTDSNEILRDVIGRIKSMAVLYDRLYVSRQYQSVDIRQYFDELMDNIRNLYSSRQQIEIKEEIDSFAIGPEIIFPLGIIINELYCNAIKYAFTGRNKGTISLQVMRIDDTITLIFQDDGIGSPGLSDAQNMGFGLRLISLLVDQIHGTMHLDSSRGMKYTLRFPL